MNLNQKEIEQLRQELPVISDDKFGKFIQLVNKLIYTQLLWSHDISKTSLTAGELRTELGNIKQHYQRALEGLQYLNRRGILPTLFDQHYLITNQVLPHKNLKMEGGSETSDIESITKELLLSISSFESSIEISRGRPKAREFQFLIIEIAKFFSSELPNSGISASAETKFFRVIMFIVTELLSRRKTYSGAPAIGDLKRHIENALEVFRASK
jgi:hypothetical protein